METSTSANQSAAAPTPDTNDVAVASGTARPGTGKGRNILLAVDGSPQSHFAVHYALELVCTPEDKLSVLYVAEAVPIVIPGAAAETGGLDVYMPEDYLEELRKKSAAESTAVVKKFATMAADCKVPCEGFFLTGDARELIVEQAAAMDADLLIIGSRGLGPVKEALLGSVSMHCLHHASCPVLIVRCPVDAQSEESPAAAGATEPTEPEPRTVVLAVDQSQAAKNAARWAMDKFCRPEEDHLVLLAVRTVASMWPRYADLYPADVTAKLERLEVEETEKRLDGLAQEARQLGFSVSTYIEAGDAREVICEAAQRLEAGVVVLGSRGLSSVTRLVLGSVSNYCCHHLKCPVLIVKTHGDKPLDPAHQSANSAHLS